MKVMWKAGIITLTVAVPAMAVGPRIFPASPDWPTPTGAQLVLLALYAAFEALALGGAVAFLVLTWPRLRQMAGERRRDAQRAYVATAWLVGNWWLHDNLHLANGTGMNGLIAIEYGFHATLIAAGALTGWYLLRSIREATPHPDW
jgi:hypothetical protein